MVITFKKANKQETQIEIKEIVKKFYASNYYAMPVPFERSLICFMASAEDFGNYGKYEALNDLQWEAIRHELTEQWEARLKERLKDGNKSKE